MKFGEIKDQVRAEANIRGDREYDALLSHIINQELQRYTGKGKCAELSKTVSFTLTAAQSSVSVPSDFQLFDNLVFTKQDSYEVGGYALGKGKLSILLEGKNGKPQFYIRQGDYFKIYPSSDVEAGDTLQLSYFYLPELVEDTDENPVTSLETAIIQSAAARILRFRDSRLAKTLDDESMQSFVDSRGEQS